MYTIHKIDITTITKFIIICQEESIHFKINSIILTITNTSPNDYHIFYLYYPHS